MNEEEKLLKVANTVRRYKVLYDEGRITYKEFCWLKDAYLSSSELDTGELKGPLAEEYAAYPDNEGKR